jgi:hypothetical protein
LALKQLENGSISSAFEKADSQWEQINIQVPFGKLAATSNYYNFSQYVSPKPRGEWQ